MCWGREVASVVMMGDGGCGGSFVRGGVVGVAWWGKAEMRRWIRVSPQATVINPYQEVS